MNCERGGVGSGKFVLIKHDDEISSDKRSTCNSFAYEGGGQDKSYEILMTGERGEGVKANRINTPLW